MKRIAVETILVEREYLVDIPNGESDENTRQRVLKCNDDGVVILPNTDRFVESVGVVLRDLKPGEDEDFIIRRIAETKTLPAGKKEKTELDKPAKPAKIAKQSDKDLINELL